MFFFVFPGIHPTTISESFQGASIKAIEILTEMANPIDLSNREALLQSATTSLSSKVGVPPRLQFVVVNIVVLLLLCLLHL